MDSEETYCKDCTNSRLQRKRKSHVIVETFLRIILDRLGEMMSSVFFIWGEKGHIEVSSIVPWREETDGLGSPMLWQVIASCVGGKVLSVVQVLWMAYQVAD